MGVGVGSGATGFGARFWDLEGADQCAQLLLGEFW